MGAYVFKNKTEFIVALIVAKQKIEKMTVKSGKIMNIGKDVESGRSATTSQNAKFSFPRFFTWLYCTLIAVLGGFWLAQLPGVGPSARLVFTDSKLSCWGFIPACLCFFGLGGARSLISLDKKDVLWSIKMFKYFFDWIATLTGGLIFADLIFSIFAYFNGPILIGTAEYFFGMMIFQTAILFTAC